MPILGAIALICFYLALLRTAAEAGTIAGRVSYPSDFIPSDMTVCVETVNAAVIKCVKSRNKFKITLPAGNYRVYAKTSEMNNYKAYYTESVVCGGGMGGMQNCDSHKPIVIKVTDTSNASNVNPQDWYAQ